jgi:alginate O-acetyltransferase complex protein AlgI
LWHGAAWSYAVWGAFHGLALALERLCSKRVSLPDNALFSVLRGLLVFSFVTLAWLLFKLPKFSDVLAYLEAIVANCAATDAGLVGHILFYSAPVIGYYAWYLLKRSRPSVVRCDFLLLGILLAAILLDAGSTGKFIYFQF